ncbi:hypothetical protein DESC_180052 [Desulfosarcina cetonica]|nr:hypothetical protein DESC_180052 [Desulfosarcina cetonica]
MRLPWELISFHVPSHFVPRIEGHGCQYKGIVGYSPTPSVIISLRPLLFDVLHKNEVHADCQGSVRLLMHVYLVHLSQAQDQCVATL